MSNNVDRAIQRTRRYWYDDGLTEIGAGLIFLALGALFLTEALAPRGSLPRNFSAVGIVALVAGGMWLVNWGVRLAKNRITFPRTGYVQYRRQPRTPQRRMAVGALAFCVAILVSALLRTTSPTSLAWIPMLQGIFIGAFILYVGYFVGLTRFYLLAILSLVAGSAISLSGFGDTLGNALYFGVLGVALLLSGAIALAAYLHQTTPSEEQ